ncbi:hypothetical protein ACC702_38300, partial [Rhizobium ruizarguesonis]
DGLAAEPAIGADFAGDTLHLAGKGSKLIDLTLVGKMLLSELAPLVGANQGVIYQVDADERQQVLSLLSVYAKGGEEAHPARLEFGQGLVGQCA